MLRVKYIYSRLLKEKDGTINQYFNDTEMDIINILVWKIERSLERERTNKFIETRKQNHNYEFQIDACDTTAQKSHTQKTRTEHHK